MKKVISILTTIGILAFTITLCLIILNTPEATGLSDNGDYIRVMAPNNINFISKKDTTTYFQKEYAMKIEGNGFWEISANLFKENSEQNIDYSSSQFLFIKISKLLNYIHNCITRQEPATYSIFYLCIQYIILFAFAILILYKSFESDSFIKNLLIFCIICFVFFDLGYIIYFNSFYGEALQYCSFMLIISILTYTVSSYRKYHYLSKLNYFLLFVFYIFTYIFTCSKSANIPLGILICITGTILTWICTKGKTKVFFTIFSIFTITLSFMFLKTIPVWMTNVTNYNSVFYGILKGSKDPYQDLFDMELNQRYISLANTNAYNGEFKYDIYSKQFDTNVYSTLSKIKIVKYYLLHPNRFFEKVAISLDNALIIKPMYLANYENNGRHIELEQNESFSLWSTVRQKIYITSMPLLIIITLALLATIIGYIIQYYKNKNEGILTNALLVYTSPILYILIYACLFLLLIASLIIPFIGNGEADLQKHMFLFNNVYDFILVYSCCFLIYNIFDIYLYLKKHKMQRITITVIILTTIITTIFIKEIYPTINIKEISFGKYNGSDIIWQVIDETDTAYMLITKYPITEASFDKSGTNYWTDSSIRKFLNTEFYKTFNDAEKKQIQPTNSTILLAKDHLHVKTSGVLPYYWNPFPSLQDTDISRYYQKTSKDNVFLLNVFEYSEKICKKGIKDKINMVFLTPYCNNTNMVRYIGKNGYIYINQATHNYTIYPCIWVYKQI